MKLKQLVTVIINLSIIAPTEFPPSYKKYTQTPKDQTPRVTKYPVEQFAIPFMPTITHQIPRYRIIRPCYGQLKTIQHSFDIDCLVTP